MNLSPAPATNDWDVLGEHVMNNFSLLAANRIAHLRVVAVALVCATLVAGIDLAARVTDFGTADGRAGSHRDQGRQVGDRVGRDPHNPLTDYVFSTSYLRALGARVFFLG
jgi:hypothetical protein